MLKGPQIPAERKGWGALGNTHRSELNCPPSQLTGHVGVRTRRE